MAKNVIIAVLSVCLVGVTGYILGQADLDRSLREDGTPQTMRRLPARASDQSKSIEIARRKPTGAPTREVVEKKIVLGDNTISHKIFDEPILNWVGRGRAHVSVIGMALNKLNAQQNELLILFKIQVRNDRFCAETTKRVFRIVVHQQGDSSAATDSSKGCGSPYSTLYGQWLAFVADSAVRDFQFVLPPIGSFDGDTPTGKMYVSVMDREEIEVQLELDAVSKKRSRFMPDEPL